MKYKNMYVECSASVYCVERKEGYYIPYECNHPYNKTASSVEILILSSRHKNIRQMLQTFQEEFHEAIENMSSFVTSNQK